MKTPNHIKTNIKYNLTFWAVWWTVILFGNTLAQDPPAGASTVATTLASTASSGSGNTAGSCVGTGTQPLVVNNYGGCDGGGGGSSSSGSSADLKALDDRLKLLEARVQLLGAGGSGGSGGSSGGGGCSITAVGDISRLGVRDCEDVRSKFGNNTNGLYVIWPPGAPTSFEVLCEFDTNNAYTVIQARVDGSVDFQRSWNEYKKGFGTMAANSNMWLGLDKIHYMTGLGPQYRLRVDLEDFDNVKRFAEYRSFSIGPESDRYRLKIFWYEDVSDAGDALSNYHNFIPFSAYDMDNDYAAQNCALEHGGGWWYRDCDNGNLNGQYNTVPRLTGPVDLGIEWDTWRRLYSLKATKMSIKRSFGNSQRHP